MIVPNSDGEGELTQITEIWSDAARQAAALARAARHQLTDMKKQRAAILKKMELQMVQDYNMHWRGPGALTPAARKHWTAAYDLGTAIQKAEQARQRKPRSLFSRLRRRMRRLTLVHEKWSDAARAAAAKGRSSRRSGGDSKAAARAHYSNLGGVQSPKRKAARQAEFFAARAKARPAMMANRRRKY